MNHDDESLEQTLMAMVDAGWIEMSIDQNGEFVFRMTEKGLEEGRRMFDEPADPA